MPAHSLNSPTCNKPTASSTQRYQVVPVSKSIVIPFLEGRPVADYFFPTFLLQICLFFYLSVIVYVFLDAATLTEVFPCFFLSCKANARVKLAKTGHDPHSSKIVVLFYVLFVLYRSMYCLCVNVYCTSATG